MNKITLVPILLLLNACAHHPADCAMGFPWSDCLAGTAGYNNGGGSETRETELKIEMAKKQQPESRDLYTELTKLDNLRKNGILTAAEYNEQKKKILDQHK